MEIRVIHLGLIKTNCFLLSGEKAAVVIDPGFKSELTADFLNQNSDKERLILITHAHFDHIGGAEQLRRDTGVKIAVGEYDNPDLADPEINLSNKFHAGVEPFGADILLKDGESLTVGDITFKVILSPGNTKGEVCFLTGDCLFSGDTLFKGAIGRTDFPGGDLKTLKRSVKRLISLPDETKVYPGHGDFTTIAFEKENNMFVW